VCEIGMTSCHRNQMKASVSKPTSCTSTILSQSRLGAVDWKVKVLAPSA
jgi:hypothetical protein